MARIKKTPTEIKYEALLRSMRKKADKKNGKKKIKRKPLPYESEKTLRTLSYGDFLKSKYWAFVREKVLKRDSYQCVICKDTKYLQVHHDTYKNHFKELNNLQDLMTLCRKCHQEHHYAQN